ncbi:putative DNA maturase A [Vibrio phage vB_VpaP_G1]|uniref:DNA maturase A n=1 Tax=Vibrio phage vB_VpaP_G1 TaxID=2862773 RepID=A0AAE7WU81_9CAUD|nr:terminase small subunit [Vibrio phage vB_VpaP_G1]QYW05819.1 putative DNA maturase A [Vibrio phage vB_VpaP_G1]
MTHEFEEVFEDDLVDAEAQRRAEEDAAFLKRLQEMSNEDLAKMLLNKSLIHLVKLINDDMATAADLSAARAFLKDNNVGIVPTRTNAAGALQEKLRQRAELIHNTPNQIPVDDLDNVDIDDFVQRH